MNKLGYVFLILLAILIFVGCPTSSELKLSSEKEIAAFIFINPAVTGIINGTDITITGTYKISDFIP